MRLIKAYHLLILIGSVCAHLSVICAQQLETGIVIDGLQAKFDTGILTYRDVPTEFKGLRGQPIFHLQLIGRDDVPAFDMEFTLKSTTSIKRIIPATGGRINADGTKMQVNMSVPRLAKGQKMNFYVILGREHGKPSVDAEAHITRTIGRGARFRGPTRNHDGRPEFLIAQYISIEDLVPNFSEIIAAQLLPEMDKSDSSTLISDLVKKGSTEQDDLSALLLIDLLDAATDLAQGITNLRRHLLAQPQQTSDPVELINSTPKNEEIGNTQPGENAL